MTDDEAITGFEDLDVPWALQIVVRNERGSARTAGQLAAAVAHAVAVVRDQARSTPGSDLAVAFATFEAGRIRKIVRHARASRWEQASALAVTVTTFDGVSVAVFAPTAMDDVPAQIAKLQLQGLETTAPTGTGDVTASEPGGLVVAVSPTVPMSGAKTAVQAAHAAHVASMSMPGDRYTAWASSGFAVSVSWPDEPHWADAKTRAHVSIHDAGFTEVEAGSNTVVALW